MYEMFIQNCCNVCSQLYDGVISNIDVNPGVLEHLMASVNLKSLFLCICKMIALKEVRRV